MMPAFALESDPCVRPSDRRSHARVPPHELSWIREVRLKYGPRVALVDLSEGGVALQTDVRLRPGSELVIEIIGRSVQAVPFRVLRSELARISDEGVIYQGAGEFKRPLHLAAASTRADQSSRMDVALRDLMVRRRTEVGVGGPPAPDASARDLLGLLKAGQDSARGEDPLNRTLQEIVTEIVPALNRAEPAALLRSRLEARLRRAVPSAGITIRSAPAQAPPGSEAIYFEAQGTAGPGVLNVQFPSGYRIPDWEFRLLQAGSYLLELLPAGSETLADPPADPLLDDESREAAATASIAAEPAPGWRKIVVRYRDGRLSKGFTHDFHPSRPQFSLWPSVDAAPAERMFVPASQLKAVFFVRDFDGNADHVDRQTFDAPVEGRRIEVTFADDEVLLGATLNYRTDGLGFFLTPADPRGNNLRVFVVASAIRHVRFL
jgi:hypothetical protein